MKYLGLFLFAFLSLSLAQSWFVVEDVLAMKPKSHFNVANLEALTAKAVIPNEKKLQLNEYKGYLDIIEFYSGQTQPLETIVAVAPVKRPDPLAAPAVLPQSKPLNAKGISNRVTKQYLVNMIYVAPNNRYANINDYFVSEGDQLPDGTKVLAIEQSRVKLQKGRYVFFAGIPAVLTGSM
ncbi:MAG: hypothetical protein IE936_00185 [Moraxella osloensis]|nr:hypothetical protein [Moraxella osloensis]MBD3767415.1 hypothetical protein [Gammaproteobacteria bacterium]